MEEVCNHQVKKKIDVIDNEHWVHSETVTNYVPFQFFKNYVLYTMIKIPCASFWYYFACWTYKRPLLILSPNNNYNALKVCIFFVACLKILYHTVFENKIFLLFIRKVVLVRKAIFAWKSFATSYSEWNSSQHIIANFLSYVRQFCLKTFCHIIFGNKIFTWFNRKVSIL